MLVYLLDWLSLLGRWLHFVVGIAWIGASLYFVWLDNHLQPPQDAEDDARGVGGELWSVHGGGFYHAQKYRGAPPQLPETLHWFKWEAYSTWWSGMFLLVLVYWYGADIYLIDPTVLALTHPQAVAAAAAVLLIAWFGYDLLCRSFLARNDTLLTFALFFFITALAWSVCQLFSGRGAYIHFGAALGTIMVGNVFRVIIPGQRAMVAAAGAGSVPDPSHALQGKQRSVHNTYLTLPVLFVMISHHYAMTYASNYNWLVLIALATAGALIRVYFVARHRGAASPWPLVIAILLLAGVAAALAPTATQQTSASVSDATIETIVAQRCATCHAQQPTHSAYSSAPAGLLLENLEQIRQASARVHEQTVVSRAMPIANLTQITEAERAQIDAWYQQLQRASGATP